jgi:hypothetical protein
MMKGKGSIRFGRPQFSDIDHPEVISVEVTDEKSGTQFLSLEIPLAEFAKALTLGSGDCEFELRPKNVGKTHEYKEEIVPVADNYVPYDKRELAAIAVVAPFEVDGWVARLSDVFNNHRRTPNGYRVTFHRYV